MSASTELPTIAAPPYLPDPAAVELEDARATSPHESHVWTATGRERPVFLDERGRRRRWVLAGGVLAGGVSSLWLGGLIAGAIGFATLPVSPSGPVAGIARTAAPAERAHERTEVARTLQPRSPVSPAVRLRVAARPARVAAVLPARKQTLPQSS